MPREDLLVSPSLRLASRVLKTDEACWRHRDILGVFQELANKSVVILGFDILTFRKGDDAVCVWGTSAYAMDECLRTRPWSECVKIALESARNDVQRVRELTNYAGDVEDFWYCLTAMRWGEPLLTG